MVRGETDKSTGLVKVSPQDTGNRGLNILKTQKMKPSLTGEEGRLSSKPAQNHTL